MSINSKLALRVLATKKSLTLMTLCLCVIIGAVILMNLEAPRASAQRPSTVTVSVSSGLVGPVVAPLSGRAGAIARPEEISRGITDLQIPVAGIAANQLRDSFYDSRSQGRVHGALDIMATGDTPVLAATDGVVMKLHQSERGGTMLYQSDATGLYVLCYGHLARYAGGISEGQRLRRGEVIGYVGDTGNAGAGNFHLHFGISRMTAAGRWYGGEPINPYPLLSGAGGATIGGK